MKILATLTISLSLLLVGCHGSPIRNSIELGQLKAELKIVDTAISEHDNIKHRINLGDTKELVLSVLLPLYESVPGRYKKQPERYTKDNVFVEIYYMRSGLTPDGLSTDDEFTPYVFNGGVLVAIGWAAIGGPKTHGQVAPAAPQINVNNSTVVY